MRDRYRRFTALAMLPFAAALVFASGADAQQQPEPDRQFVTPGERITVKARTGAAIPAGNLGDIVDPGFNAGLGIGIPLANRVRFTVSGDVSLLSEIDSDGEFGEGEVEQFFDDGLRLWNYGGGLEFDLTDPAMSDFTLMLTAGAGATTIDPQETFRAGEVEVEPFDRRTRFSANGGLEIGFQATESVDLFVGAESRAIFLQSGDFEPIPDLDDQIEDTWWTFPVRAGVQFRL